MPRSSNQSLKELILSSTEVLFEDAPCGYIFTYPDGLLLKTNRTFLKWLDLLEDDLVEKKKFQELLSVGSRIYYDTNYAPLLRMQGFLNEITLDLDTKNGTMPVLISSSEMRGEDGEVLLIKSTLFDIRDRRKYERDLLLAKNEAQQAANRALLLAKSGEVLRRDEKMDQKLQLITQLAVEEFCDVSTIDLSENSQWKRVAQDQRNEDRLIPSLDAASQSLRESIFIPELDPADNPPLNLKPIIDSIDPQSIIISPIIKNSETIGTLSFFLTRLGKRFTEKDRELAEELAFSVCATLERSELQEENDRMTLDLKESHEWFSTTLRSIGDAVLVIDPEKRVSFLNGIAEELTGWKNAEAKGRDMDEVFCIVNETTNLPAKNPVDQVLKDGKATLLENHTALVRRDGTRIIIEDSAAPIKVEDSGRLHGVVLVFRDTTQKYIEEKKKADLLEELQVEKEIREKFVSTLTHDLRSPLSAVKLNVELLKRRFIDESALPIIERSLKGIKRIDQMIQSLLDANSLRAGNMISLELSEVHLLALTEEILEEMRLVHGDRFRVVAPVEIDGVWSADGLRRIIENLCNNAIKYGSETAPVTLRLLREGDIVTISVHNEGDPIMPEDQKDLFQPFQRNLAHRNKRTGWGLGLSLVKGVAEAHGGSVSVQSSQETGTTFTVKIPLISH